LRGLLIAVSGIVAAIVGTAGGITSLVSYPALLAVGVPPFAADVANLVALVACWPGSALASRPELAGRAPWLRRWVWVAAAGGALGSALLLSTSANAFREVVPYLVAAGSVALLAAPAIPGIGEHHTRRHTVVRFGGLLLVSAYGGYFGAGSGIMTLALLLITVDSRIPAANALKNMLIGAAALVSALIFIRFGPVDWAVTVPLGAGMFVGSLIGPRVARRMPADLLRWLVALLGIALAIKLWVAP
jgi:uncharacterized membrane protein YfcA